MKGIVFNILEDMAIEKGGLALWQQVLDRAEVQGIYTAVGTYEDQELYRLVEAVSDLLNIPRAEIIKAFGGFMFVKLAESYPEFLAEPKDLFSFLYSIDSVIHLEVRKLLSETRLPRLVCSEPEPNRMKIDYRSPRKLCILAEGLIQGAAEHFGENIRLEHPVCMHSGADHCELWITRTDG